LTWDESGDPLTRSAYEAVEQFEADNGRTYIKARVKGIGATKYLSRTGGPGRTISKSWYQEKKRDEQPPDGPPRGNPAIRITATCKYETRYQHERHGVTNSEAKIEIGGLFRPDVAPTRQEIVEKINGLQDKANEQLPFVQDCNPNIERKRVRTTRARDGWRDGGDDSYLQIDMDHAQKSFKYDAHPDQTTIDDF
jgi:hypothetical protein